MAMAWCYTSISGQTQGRLMDWICLNHFTSFYIHHFLFGPQFWWVQSPWIMKKIGRFYWLNNMVKNHHVYPLNQNFWYTFLWVQRGTTTIWIRIGTCIGSLTILWVNSFSDTASPGSSPPRRSQGALRAPRGSLWWPKDDCRGLL